jgi:hypothetical protein
MNNLDGVLEAIAIALSESVTHPCPHPNPLPQTGKNRSNSSIIKIVFFINYSVSAQNF